MKSLTTVCLAGGVLLSVGVAQAEISGNVALSSDYIFRGQSQTDNTPSISGGFDYEHDSGFYAGVWAANVDSGFYSGANVEIDTYLGFSGGDALSWDVGILRYNYPGTSFSDNNTNEWYGSVGHDFGFASVTGGLAYSTDFFGADDGEYWTLEVEVPLPAEFSLALHYGYTDTDGSAAVAGVEYDDYSIGVSKEYIGLGFDLTWTAVGDVDFNPSAPGGFGNLDDSRVVFTVSKSL